MPGTPNTRQRSHQLATQQLPFMPGLLLRRGGRCPSMPRIMMACIEDRGRLPLPPGMAVVCRALAGGGGCCAVVAIHLLMLASRRAVADFSPLLPPFRCGASSRADTGIVEKGPGPRLPPSTALGGRGGFIVGCVTPSGWRSDSTHERARVLPLFPVPAGVRPPNSIPPTPFGPGSAVSLPPSLSSQCPPPPQIAALQPLQEDPPTPGWFAIPRPCFPARFPAPLHHQRRPASRYPGVLRYRGTSFFCSPSLWRCWRGSSGQADAAACAVGPATSVVSTHLSCP